MSIPPPQSSTDGELFFLIFQGSGVLLARFERGHLGLAAPIPATLCQRQVNRFRVDLLHLMCKSRVQTGTPQLNDMVADLTDDHPGHPPAVCH